MSPKNTASTLALVVFLTFAALGEGRAEESSPTPATKVETARAPDADRAERVDRIIKGLSAKQKIGQILVLGFVGTEYSRRLAPIIEFYQPGAIIVFKRNIQSPIQIARLNQQAQKRSRALSNIPLFIMVDQEGGSVTRIQMKPNPPSALAIGMAGDPHLAETAGAITGRLLHVLGFNMNLAPVVDLSNPFEINFIGNRSFGNHPDKVYEMASGFATGLHKNGVLPTLKHFPGHGGIAADSHRLLPKKLDSLEELSQKDLVPFKRIAESGLPTATMVAHVAFPNIDPSGEPATYSHKLVTDVLKEQLGYRGLVLSDDLEMSGANSVGGVGERAVKAFEAGNDMVMVAWKPEHQLQAFRSLHAALDSGRISHERLNQSLRKIIALKLDLERTHPPLSLSNADIRKSLEAAMADLKALSHKTSQANFINSAAKTSHLSGSLKTGQAVVVFSADPEFARHFQETVGGPLESVLLRKDMPAPVELKMTEDPEALGVYYATGVGTVRRLKDVPAAIRSRLIVVNTTQPGLIENPQQYRGIINLNTPDAVAGRWLGEFLREKPQDKPDLREPSSDPEENGESTSGRKESSRKSAGRRRDSLVFGDL